MTTTIVDLQAVRFQTRIALGGCLLNFEGETYDCEVATNNENPTHPTFIVTDKFTGKELCTFRPWDVHALDDYTFSIAGAARKGRSTATVIVPPHGMLPVEEEEEDDE